MAKKKIKVEGLNIQIKTEGEQDYISLTDIAKSNSSNRPATTIQSWLRNQNTISYLGTWEKVHNPNFKVSHLADFRDFASDNRSAVTPKAWIKAVEAIGLTSTSGRYGGTFAHSDIALEFCSWLSPEFKVYFVKEFQRLKEQEARQLNIEWNIRRELAKAHYPMLKEAVIENLPTGKKKAGFYLADEADLINELVFGMTAQQWRKKYPNGIVISN